MTTTLHQGNQLVRDHSGSELKRMQVDKPCSKEKKKKIDLMKLQKGKGHSPTHKLNL